MLFMMVKVNRRSIRRIMVGRVKVREVLLVQSSASNVVFLVIVFQSVLRWHVRKMGKLGIRLMIVIVLKLFLITVERLVT